MLTHLVLAAVVSSTPPQAAQPTRRAVLEAGLLAELPRLSPAEAADQVDAALASETPDLPAELMIGVAIRESGLDSGAGPACGVMQVLRKYLGRSGCALARSGPAAGYAAGVAAYAAWVVACRGWQRAGRLHRGVTLQECALNAYAEGGLAGRRGWGVRGCRRHRHCDRAAGPLGRARRIAAGVVTAPAATS